MILLVAVVLLVGWGIFSWLVERGREQSTRDPFEKTSQDRISELEQWNSNWSHPEMDDGFYTWDPKKQEFKEASNQKRSLIEQARSPEHAYFKLYSLFLEAFLEAAPENRKRMQSLLGVPADGVFGPVTYQAMSNTGSWLYLQDILYPPA